MYQLRSNVGTTYPLGTNGLRIGRSSSNDVVVTDPRVSRAHAQVLFAGGRVWVRDEGSQHGTFINGQRIQGQQEFRAGDTLRIGAVSFNLIAAPAYAPAQQYPTQNYPLAYPQQPAYQQPQYYPQSTVDPNTAFIIELIGGLFGLLGLGYFYTGKTGDGVLRLLGFIAYNFAAWFVIWLLSLVVIGIFCVPVQVIIQVGIPIWSAVALKNQIMSGR